MEGRRQVLGALLLIAVAGCDDPATVAPPVAPLNPTVAVPDSPPALAGEVDLVVEVTDAAGAPVPGARVVLMLPVPELEWAREFGEIEYVEFASDARVKAELMRRTGGLRAESRSTDEKGLAVFRTALTRDMLSTPQLVTATVAGTGITSSSVSLLDTPTYLADFETGSVTIKFSARALGRAELKGKVTRGGAPVSPSVVRLRGDQGRLIAETGVDDDGSYRLTGLPAGEFTLQVLDRGYVEETGTIALSEAESKTRDVEVPVSGRITIVLGLEGPSAGSGSEAVVAVGSREPTFYRMPVPGGLGVTGLALDTRVGVTVEAFGLRVASTFECSSSDAEHRVVKKLPAPDVEVFRGTVTDEKGGLIAGSQVQLKLLKPSEEAARLIEASRAAPIDIAAVTDDKGRFVFKNLLRGEYEAAFYFNGFLQDVRPVFVGGGDLPELVARHLDLDRAIAGRVEFVDASGAVSPAGRTSLMVMELEKSESGEHRVIARKYGVTEPDGSFRVEGLAPLRYFVMAGTERGGVVIPDALGDYDVQDLIRNEERTGIIVRCYQGPVLYGYVEGEGVEVRMSDRVVRSEAAGLFVFTGVAPGIHQLRALVNGQTLEREIELRRGDRMARVEFK